MDTTTLRTFITLAEIKNFTKTAQQLFVAQSTVTNRIRDLETELGVALFIRNHKQVDLTPAGLKSLRSEERRVGKECRSRIRPAFYRIGNDGTARCAGLSYVCKKNQYRYDKYDL